MKRSEFAQELGYVLMMMGVVETLAGFWQQYHATTPREAMAHWEGPTLLLMSVVSLGLGRTLKKSSEGV